VRKPAFTEHHFRESVIFNSNQQSQSPTAFTLHRKFLPQNFTESPPLAGELALRAHPHAGLLRSSCPDGGPRRLTARALRGAGAPPPPGHLTSSPPPPHPGGRPFRHCHNPHAPRLPCDWMAALALPSCSSWKHIPATRASARALLLQLPFPCASRRQSPPGHRGRHFPSVGWPLFRRRKHFPFLKHTVLSGGVHGFVGRTLCDLNLDEGCLSAAIFVLWVTAVQ